MRVGERIRELREKAGVSQVELSEKVGISQSMLCQIERETKNPSLQVGKLIAEALGCEIADLFEQKENTAPAV